jgi:glycosyltransferase involved in cell wall biosynthesis
MKQKTLYLTHEYDAGGGVATVVRNLRDNLNNTDREIDVLVKRYDAASATLIEHNGEQKVYSSVEDALTNRKYDLAHIHSISFADSHNGKITKILEHITGPIVYTCHSVVANEIIKNAERYASETGKDPEETKQIWLTGAKKDLDAQNQLLSLADRVVNMTETGKNILLQHYPEMNLLGLKSEVSETQAKEVTFLCCTKFQEPCDCVM